jgi:hypothetical protein
MKYDSIYKRRQSAGRMEAVLLAGSGLGAVTAVYLLFAHGWVLAGLAFLLSLVTFAMSRLFDLLSELLGCVGRLEEHEPTSQQRKNEPGS